MVKLNNTGEDTSNLTNDFAATTITTTTITTTTTTTQKLDSASLVFRSSHGLWDESIFVLLLYGSNHLDLNVATTSCCATTTKPRLGPLAPASEVAGGHTIPF
jgi:hypothetical protein